MRTACVGCFPSLVSFKEHAIGAVPIGRFSHSSQCALDSLRFQLLHGMENTTNLMLAQFAAGLVHFADYKRCKVLGDLLGVDDPTTGPPFDHRSALFLYRFLAELRTVSSSLDYPRQEISKGGVT